MRINTRTVALALTAVTLFTINIAMSVKGDSTMSSIFYIISKMESTNIQHKGEEK